MRVIVRTARIAQPALRNQIPRHDTGCPDDLLGSKTAEIKRIGSGIQCNAVHRDFLADIARNNICVIATLFQVIIEPLGRSVRQVEGFSDISLDHPFVRVQGKKVQVKGGNVVAGLYRDVIPPVAGKGFQRFAAGQYVNLFLGRGDFLMRLIGHVAAENKGADDDEKAKKTDLLKGGLDILWFGKHHTHIFKFTMTK